MLHLCFPVNCSQLLIVGDDVCFQNHHVWCQLNDHLWESGQIKSTSGEKASILMSDGSVRSFNLPFYSLLMLHPTIIVYSLHLQCRL